MFLCLACFFALRSALIDINPAMPVCFLCYMLSHLISNFTLGPYIYYCGQESHRRKEVSLILNERVQNAVLGYNLKNDRMILVRFQGKSFNITVIQVYVPTTDAEEAEVDQFYEGLEDLLELTHTHTHTQRCSIHHWGLECKSSKSRDTWSNRQVWPRRTK